MNGRLAKSCWLLLLSLMGVRAGDWSVRLLSGPISAVIGSSVVLPCSYDYPQDGEGEQVKVLSEMWCLEDSRCITSRYVFHSDAIFPHPSYQNRVEYLGKPGSKNCSLRISDVRQSDSGAYVFYLVTSHPSQKMPEQSGVQLLVADSPSAVAVLASPPSDITEGVALRLACGSPAAGLQARYRWFKSPSSSPGHTGQVWSIGEVTSGDSGSYYCQLQAGGEEQNSTMLHVDVEYSPRNTVVSASRAAEDELPVTLTCSSDANPPVHTFAWYQGAACLPTADKSSHLATRVAATPAGRGLTLSSANITAEQYDHYCCVARNRHGSQTESVALTDSTASSSSDSTGVRLLIIGLTVAVVLVIISIVAFLKRKQKTSNQSYVLTETTVRP